MSGRDKVFVYLVALAGLFFSAMVVPIFFLVIFAAGVDGFLGVAIAMIAYLVPISGLLIAYTWRFWFVPNQMSVDETWWRAALCGFLFPIMVILLVIIVGMVTGSIGDDGTSLVALIISLVLSFFLTKIGIVRSPLKQP